MRDNDISLRKWSGGIAHLLLTLEGTLLASLIDVT